MNEAEAVARTVPAVVDVDELIAGRLHPARHHGVGGLANQLLTDVALELVPAVPSHRGRLRQRVELLGLRTRRGDAEEQKSEQAFHRRGNVRGSGGDAKTTRALSAMRLAAAV